MSTTLKHLLASIDCYLEKDITELAINKPGEIYLEERGAWVSYPDQNITAAWLEALASAVANKQSQSITVQNPLLSTTLSSGLRIQIVKPPACVAGTFIVAIRKPDSKTYTREQYRRSGFFDDITEEVEGGLAEHDIELMRLKKERKFEDFLDLAIKTKKNIVVSGATSTGKTTFTNHLLDCIPLEERIATIEDSEELRLPHKNQLRLLYSKGGQGTATVTAGDLLEACLRLTPDRIILSEIRGAETFAFMDTIFSGHDGCITSMHASSPLKAFRRMIIMFKKDKIGSGFDTKEVQSMLISQVDIIVQIKRSINGRRYISEIYFDPLRQQRYAAGAMDGNASSIETLLVKISLALDSILELLKKPSRIFAFFRHWLKTEADGKGEE